MMAAGKLEVQLQIKYFKYVHKTRDVVTGKSAGITIIQEGDIP